jgi:hypothetical protein
MGLFMKFGSVEGLLFLALIAAIFVIGWAIGRRSRGG